MLTLEGSRYTEKMTGRRAILMVIGLLIAGAGVAFLIVGLDQADKAASVIGALAGLAGLGFSVWAYRKPASLPMNMSKWRDVRVTDSTMVHIGNGGTMEGTFGTDMVKRRRSTRSDNTGEQLDGSGFDPPQD